GAPISAGTAFAKYRDAYPKAAGDARGEHMVWIFNRLAQAGIAPKDLYLAWDFTVASKRNLSERMLHIRDDAFAQLGDKNLADLKVAGSAPRYVINPDLPDGQQPDVDGVQDFTPEQDPYIARRVQGRVLVPCYL